jgi:hypothetical protein
LAKSGEFGVLFGVGGELDDEMELVNVIFEGRDEEDDDAAEMLEEKVTESGAGGKTSASKLAPFLGDPHEERSCISPPP